MNSTPFSERAPEEAAAPPTCKTCDDALAYGASPKMVSDHHARYHAPAIADVLADSVWLTQLADGPEEFSLDDRVRLRIIAAALSTERAAREALEARDQRWLDFAFRVGESVKCLASTFPDANEHIEKRVAESSAAHTEAERQRDALREAAEAALRLLTLEGCQNGPVGRQLRTALSRPTAGEPEQKHEG